MITQLINLFSKWCIVIDILRQLAVKKFFAGWMLNKRELIAIGPLNIVVLNIRYIIGYMCKNIFFMFLFIDINVEGVYAGA